MNFLTSFLRTYGLLIAFGFGILVPQLILAQSSCSSTDIACRVRTALFVCGDPVIAPAPCQIGDLLKLVNGIINVLLFIVITPIAIGLLLWGGLLLVTSPSKPAQVSQAKNILWTALKGYGIALVGYVVVKTIVLGLLGSNDVANYIKSVFTN